MCTILRAAERLESLALKPVPYALSIAFAGTPCPAYMLSLPRNAQLWLPGLLSSKLQRLVHGKGRSGTIDVFFCIADHFEPAHGDVPLETERARVARWVEAYPQMIAGLEDTSGRPPQHTFFFPEEGYRPELLDALADLCKRGFGDVEVHLHHDRDTGTALAERLGHFTDALFHKHGLLRRDSRGRIAFGFVHGNWALDNARPDGRWCGVNNEITILRNAGCYADFTLPAAPDASQTRTINSIYYAIDDPHRPRSHEYGIPARVGRTAPEGGLLILQGPLDFDMRRRIWAIFPGLENAAIDASDAHQPTAERFATWIDADVTIEGRPEWVFVKVHTHGATEENADVLLGPIMRRFHSDIARAFNDGRRYRLHYVTAYEMATLVKAAEAGLTGNPLDLFRQPLI